MTRTNILEWGEAEQNERRARKKKKGNGEESELILSNIKVQFELHNSYMGYFIQAGEWLSKNGLYLH